MIDPSIVAHESEIYRNLVSQHVSEDRTDFAILATADRLKDYSARHMTGVVGDGLAYLQMIRDGYEWFDHFENLPLTGSSGTARSPDFEPARRSVGRDLGIKGYSRKLERAFRSNCLEGLYRAGLSLSRPEIRIECGVARVRHRIIFDFECSRRVVHPSY
ncbi:hypothetical protein [Rhizobium fabae]|uniref:Uncharacterized protein n=1 Tax=Rhizobium fabae TaxID=573179 RepID=A0A7W6BA97_9HYPH|nr:hypothetical protein [Rhizobium fabae]MBB3918672.1 hypothetical protein [Rhizobium fabae]